MTSATSGSEAQKNLKWDEERALVARQLNIAKGRQALTIKKLKAQGFDVSPVQREEPVVPTTIDSVIKVPEPDIEDARPMAAEEEITLWNVVRNAGLAILSTLITKLVIDYTYPRLRELVIPTPVSSDDEVRDDVWHNQSIFK